MHFVDARRLTGSSLLARTPLVVVELDLEADENVEAAREAYRAELRRMRDALGLLPVGAMVTRPHRGGVVFGYEAPIDVLLASAEMSEWAALSAVETMAGRPALSLEPKRAEVAAMWASESSPRLLALAKEASARAVPLLWDDERVTLGMGHRSRSFPAMPRDALPDVGEVDWASLGPVPVALVTGTNGKTTSSRLVAFMAREAGFRVGSASTGGIAVDGVVVDRGDWTGPAAARAVLRRSEVDFAVLETARGGILRRGLAVPTCDVALVTNVSDDHLGGYGIDDLATMVEVKGVVARAVAPRGSAVLSARDPNLVALGRTLSCAVVWFANLDGDAAANEGARSVVADARARGETTVIASGGAVLVTTREGEREWMRIGEAPITFGGAADYNVDNLLGAIGAALSLGLPEAAIVCAARAFDMADNPGRGQLTEHDGVRVLRDFGHNADGVRGVMQLVTRLRGGRGKLTVITGSAGDRSDREVHALAAAIQEAAPDRVIVRELSGYLRGRALGEVPEVFRRAFLSLGLLESAFSVADSEVLALESAFAEAHPGDFVVVLVHLDEAGTRAFLASRG